MDQRKIFLKLLLIKELKILKKTFLLKNCFYRTPHEPSSKCFLPLHSKCNNFKFGWCREWATTSIAIGEENRIKILKELHYPHSLGLLYSAFTQYLGFKVNSGEYKVMGLAPYGEPKFFKLICDNLVDIKEDGSFKLNMKYFNYLTGLTMVNKNFENLFGNKTREYDSENLSEFHMDVAASIQKVIEFIVLKITDHVSNIYRIENLCLSGGSFKLVANSKIYQNGNFKKIWVQPASGDAGGSLGAALTCYFQHLNNKRVVNPNDSMKGAFLGQTYDDKDIEEELLKNDLIFKKYNREELISTTAKLISKSNVIGWFQGRMEFGPKVFGMSIYTWRPRSKDMQKILNLKLNFEKVLDLLHHLLWRKKQMSGLNFQMTALTCCL